MSQLDGPSRGVYTGTSSQEDQEGPTLEKALRDGYEKAKAGKPGQRTFRVVQILVSGENPPTDIKVELIDH